MNEDKIQLYEVKDCPSFLDFLETIKTYGSRTAFRNYTQVWTYNDLYYKIQKLTSYFSRKETKYYYINIDHPVYFCLAFFAVTISGNTALLGANTFTGIDTEEHIEIVEQNEVIHLLKTVDSDFVPKTCDSKKLAVIAQSSGTTSVSKGVMLSQKNILSDMVGGMRCYDYSLGAIYYHVLPYFHLFGLVADMLGPLYSGGTICFSNNRLSFFRDIQFFKPTNMNLPPAMVYVIEDMLIKTKNIQLATGGGLKKIMCAGAHLNDSSRNMLKRFGVSVFPAYGLTECSPCISMNSDLFFKPNSVGRILPCCEVSIKEGEITVRGDNVMLGYWNDQNATDNTIKDGWLYTGDLGYIDEEGFLFLLGRKSNLIVFEDGTKLIPELLEEEISEILGVKECLVIKKIIANHIRIKLIVVAESNGNKEKITQQVNECFEKYHCLDKLTEILFSEEDLPKNKLGKIIRK